MQSVWKYDIEKPRFNKLNGEIKTEVLIIGGGMAGLLCGYELKKAGVDCVIAEADEFCGGVTGNTTAKITLQHGAIFDKMIKHYGIEKARLYYKAQNLALEEYKKLCQNIDCDFSEKDNYVYSVSDRQKIKNEVTALNKIGCKATFEENLPLPFSASAVCVKNQGQFNPLKFAYSIAKDLKIYEHTKIKELKPSGAVTENGKIKAKKIIVATHFPFLNKHGMYFLKMYQHRSYVLALKNAPDIHGMYVDESDTGLSFRNYNGMLLFGGGGHRTGKQGGGYNELLKTAGKFYPKAEVVCRWATQDCITLDDIPYIGQYSKNTPNLYVATGFNKWGMTSSMVSAKLLTDLICGNKNEFAKAFSPSRSVFHPKLMANAFESTVGLITPTAPRCPHLGCALKYNKQEHSWDCACHGSRFTKEGILLDNPATGNLDL